MYVLMVWACENSNIPSWNDDGGRQEGLVTRKVRDRKICIGKSKCEEQNEQVRLSSTRHIIMNKKCVEME